MTDNKEITDAFNTLVSENGELNRRIKLIQIALENHNACKGLSTMSAIKFLTDKCSEQEMIIRELKSTIMILNNKLSNSNQVFMLDLLKEIEKSKK